MILPPVVACGTCLPCGGDAGAVNPAPCPTGVVPGPQGAVGPDGVPGSNGSNAYTTLSAGFTVPAVSADVTVAVGSTNWMAVGQIIFIQSAGWYQVAAINDATDVASNDHRNGSTRGGERTRWRYGRTRGWRHLRGAFRASHLYGIGLSCHDDRNAFLHFRRRPAAEPRSRIT